jgi:hypothetical protein
MSAPSFLGMAQDLLLDADAKAAFEADPDGFLAARGFAGLSPADLADAVGFVADTLPPGPAEALTAPDAGGDALARLAQIDPVDLAEGAEEVDASEPMVLLETDPSGELDLSEGPEALFDDPIADPGADPTNGAETGRDDDSGESDFGRSVEAEADPGFGVGFSVEDADDVLPTELADPVVDLDATLVPELAVEPGDVDHALDLVPEDHGGGLHHADVEHHDDADAHDGHHDDAPGLDLDL